MPVRLGAIETSAALSVQAVLNLTLPICALPAFTVSTHPLCVIGEV
jgi:hypothetical protein